MTAYYNEIEPYAAAWLRNLIAAGQIAPGEVDTRSIEDVHPADLQDFTQCHFFAGIGVWSLALRRAGWGDDRPVWTGSCPCQPFSAAGKGAGFSDERHLWPAFHHLIDQRRPAVVFGEQVASKDADAWIDLVQDDLEGVGYRVGAVPFPSAGVGAPHIRDRLYWVANANSGTREQGGAHLRGRIAGSDAQPWARLGGGGVPGGLGDPIGTGLAQRERERGIPGRAPGAVKGEAAVGAGIYVGGLADTGCERLEGQRLCLQSGRPFENHVEDGRRREVDSPGPTNGFWRDADWLGCRDDKWRPVEPGTSPLAHGATSRVGRLRAYGNAINAEAARVFIEAVMDCQP